MSKVFPQLKTDVLPDTVTLHYENYLTLRKAHAQIQNLLFQIRGDESAGETVISIATLREVLESAKVWYV